MDGHTALLQKLDLFIKRNSILLERNAHTIGIHAKSRPGALILREAWRLLLAQSNVPHLVSARVSTDGSIN